MNKNSRPTKIAVIFGMVIIGVLVLSACAPAATPAPPPTQPPSSTAAPTSPPPPPGPTPDPNMPVAVVPPPASGEPSALAKSDTTIYSGPGENYVMYTILLGGKTAKVTGKSEDGKWWVISVPPAPNGQGWVSGAWVSVTGADGVPVVPTPPVPPSTELVPPGPDDPQATTIAIVYVRMGPGQNYPAYGTAPYKATARVIGKSEDGLWWVVRLNPKNIGVGYGWVLAQYTQATNVENVQTIATPPAPQTVVISQPANGVPTAVAVENLNVRTGPSKDYPVLGDVPAGSSAEVAGKSSDGAWWQVKIPTQYDPTGLGWVEAAFVYTVNTANVPVVTEPAPPPPVETTPAPTSTPSSSSSTSTSGCLLSSKTPADYTAFSPGASFSTTWVLQNTGTTKWDQSEYDIGYAGAVANIRLHQGSDIYDLTTTVEPGSTYNFTVPMIAPFDPGTYGELWQVRYGSQPICDFYIYITVK
jgi:uncharacterized protein YraI